MDFSQYENIDFNKCTPGVDTRGDTYTIYGSKKIQIRMTKVQQRFIFNQLGLSSKMRTDIIRYIFDYIGSLIKEAKLGNELAQSELKMIKGYTSTLYHKIGNEITEALYHQKYRDDGILMVNFQDALSEICMEISTEIRHLGKFKLSKLPYYEVYRKQATIQCTKFCLTRSFSKDRNSQYGDSLHIRLPHLNWVRLKDRKGYFTLSDWQRCYKVIVVRKPSRTYLIFCLKAESDYTNEEWSAKANSYFRRLYIEKYRTPIAPSSLIREIYTSSKIENINPRMIPKYREEAQRVEAKRGMFSLMITRDFSLSIMKFWPPANQYNGLVRLQHHYQKLSAFPYFSFDVSLDKTITDGIQRYNALYSRMVNIINENLMKEGLEPYNYSFSNIKNPFKIHQMKNRIFHDPRLDSLRRRRNRIRTKISNIILNYVNQMISVLCRDLPKMIYIRFEDFISSMKRKNILSTFDVSSGMVGLFLERLFNKARMLEIPIFVLDDEYIKAVDHEPDFRKVCPWCNKPYEGMLYYNPSLHKDWNTVPICSNDKCQYKQIGAHLSIAEMYTLQLPDYHTKIRLSTFDKSKWLNVKYLRRWYPRYRKFRPKGAKTINEETGRRIASDPDEPLYIFGPEYDPYLTFGSLN